VKRRSVGNTIKKIIFAKKSLDNGISLPIGEKN
jgi:hypothetical protein